MMRRLGLLLVAVALFSLAPAFAADEPPARPQDVTIIMPPSARVMLRDASKVIVAKQFASNLKGDNSKLYGFTTGVSPEKGSFKLGVLMADLEAAVRGGAPKEALKAIQALNKGLATLGAPMSMIAAVANMGVAIRSGVALEAMEKASLPVIKPFIEEFIKKEGKMAYLRFGEWAESVRLVLQSSGKGQGKIAQDFLKSYNYAGYFLEEFKNKDLAPGAVSSLKDLARIANSDLFGERESRTALKAIDNIFMIMG